MAFARIITVDKGTPIRTVKYDKPVTIGEVDRMAAALDSIIEEEHSILKVEVDYTGCEYEP